MNFYDILFQQQNAEKVPYSKSYFDTLFAQKFSNVKTLTGTLPLTFTTSETKLRSWTIYGADIEHEKTATGKSISFYTDEDKLRDWTIYGNDSVGKNLLEITAETQTINGVTFTVDKQAGTITANGKALTAAYLNLPIDVPSGDYYFSGCALGGSASTYDLYAWDNTTNSRPKKWDGETNVDSDYGGTSQEVKVDSEHSMQLTIRIRSGYTCSNLVFKPMLRPADTTADFEPYQQGVGQRTKNLLEINEATDTIRDVTFTVDKSAGTITTSGTATGGSAIFKIYIDTSLHGDFSFAGCADGGTSSTYYIDAYDETAGAKCKAWDGTSTSVNCYNTEQRRQMQIPENHICCLRIIFARNVNADGYVFMPMLIDSEATQDTLIPYGYQVPVQSGGVTTNVFIGSDPLIAGESVSKTSTGVDIPTTPESYQTLTTSLYNQPEMSITYNEFTGVGIHGTNVFMIALQVKAGGSFVSAFSILLNKPLRAGETLTSEQTGETIQTVAGVENKLTPSPKAESYGGSFDMTIKYKE